MMQAANGGRSLIPACNFSFCVTLLAWFALAAPVSAQPPGAGGPPPALPVEAQPVMQRELTQTLTAIGTLQSDESVALIPETTGVVREIRFEEGEPVAAGAVMIRLDDALEQAELAQAQADLSVARRSFNRQDRLFKRGTGSEQARDEALGLLEAAQARVQLAQAKLAKTRLVAPFDGVAGLRQVSVGDYVAPGQALVTLEKLEPIKVEFAVPETMLRLVQVGQPLAIEVAAYPGERFPGRVYALDARVEATTRSLLVRALIDNPDRRLRPGLFAEVDLVLATHPDALVVPEEAIVSRGGAQLVYTVVDGQVEVVPVELGLRREGQVEIVAGLDPDALVITAGQLKVGPGQPVTVLPPAGAAAPGEPRMPAEPDAAGTPAQDAATDPAAEG